MASESTEQIFGVVRQIPHESYSSSDMQNDIMLIELDVSLFFFFKEHQLKIGKNFLGSQEYFFTLFVVQVYQGKTEY